MELDTATRFPAFAAMLPSPLGAMVDIALNVKVILTPPFIFP